MYTAIFALAIFSSLLFWECTVLDAAYKNQKYENLRGVLFVVSIASWTILFHHFIK